MRRCAAIVVLAISTVVTVAAVPSLAQQQAPQGQTESTRKLLSRVAPDYPEIAKQMGIAGAVKVEVVIAPNGTAKSVEAKGGHPLLIQAAVNAVHRWKWSAGPHETKELVEVKFEQ
jgi:TonB family protein